MSERKRAEKRREEKIRGRKRRERKRRGEERREERRREESTKRGKEREGVKQAGRDGVREARERHLNGLWGAFARMCLASGLGGLSLQVAQGFTNAMVLGHARLLLEV